MFAALISNLVFKRGDSHQEFARGSRLLIVLDTYIERALENGQTNRNSTVIKKASIGWNRKMASVI